MSYDVEYLGFWGPIRLLLVPIIARTPQDMLLEKLANKKILSGFMHNFIRKK